MRENGTICPLCIFFSFSEFIVIFASTLDISHFKRSVPGV